MTFYLNTDTIIENIIEDIKDRRGLKHAWNRIPPENVDLIMRDWSIIISELQNSLHLLVDSIISDFSSRYGITYEWDSIDDDVKDDIRSSWYDIVKEHTSEL